MSARVIRQVSSTPLKAEGKRAWSEFKKIRATIPGLDDPQLSRYIRELKDAESGDNFYTYFPFLFAEAFPDLTQHQMHKLALTGVLMLYHLLINDEIVDQRDAQCAAAMLASNSFQLSALKNFSELFDGRPAPWKDVLRLYRQYSLATLLEDGGHRNKLQQYLSRDRIRILSRKSAMAKIIVVSLCRLSGRDDLLRPLEDSFDSYFAAEQLFDDFKDWKEDLAAGRYTYLITTTIMRFNLQEKLDALAPESRISTLAKYLYLSGIAEDYLLQVVHYCREAKRKVESLDCPRWKERIDSLMMGVHGVRSEVAINSRRTLLQTASHQYALLSRNEPSSNGQCPHPVWRAPRQLSEGASEASRYLIKGRGMYEDFMAFGETLPIWVSAYVGCALGDWAKLGAEAQAGKKNRGLTQLLDRMRKWLAGEKQQRGWPCLRDVPEDADTTAWVARFLAETGPIPGSETQELIKLVLGYQQPDGGFNTIPPEGRSGFQSYGMSHVEVTAVAVETLLKLGVEPSHESIRRAVGFIRDVSGSDGIWEAFWWDGQMYATFYSIRALVVAGETISERDRTRMAEAIMQRQSADGCWGLELTGKNLAFETALAVRSLLLLGAAAREHQRAVERGATWLLNFQNGDGSFSSRPMLRIPNADDLSPWATRHWDTGSAAGLGVLVADHNAYFTTATVLNALADFLRIYGDRNLVVTRAAATPQ
ncbi:MAG TPA: hypothetical protein VJH03_14660 [Blastocatellia bacterium]|nr:hypothetical protein [Blastocatellia bacterium]